MVALDVGPDGLRVAFGVDLRRRLAELVLRLRQLAVGDLQQRIDRDVYALVVAQLRLVIFLTDGEGRRRVGLRLLQVLEVFGNRLGGDARRLLKLGLQPGVFDRREGFGQVVLHEVERPFEAFDADFQIDRRRVVDVAAGGVEEARHQFLFGNEVAQARIRRRVFERSDLQQRARQHVIIEAGVALVAANLLQLQQARLHVGGENLVVENVRQPEFERRDLLQPRLKFLDGGDLVADGRGAVIFEPPLPGVQAAGRRRRRVARVEVAEILLYKFRKARRRERALVFILLHSYAR